VRRNQAANAVQIRMHVFLSKGAFHVNTAAKVALGVGASVVVVGGAYLVLSRKPVTAPKTTNTLAAQNGGNIGVAAVTAAGQALPSVLSFIKGFTSGDDDTTETADAMNFNDDGELDF
jgi:hypothetical protein